MTQQNPSAQSTPGELARLFLRLGALSFGGPAAHIAVMEEEVVKRRNWLTHEHFLDLIGVTNLIPGPNSTEMAIHIGYLRAGWRGLIIAGVCFILPAVLITLLLAQLYVSYGSLPSLQPFTFGIRPALIAIIAATVVRLGKPMAKNTFMAVVALLVTCFSIAGVDEILLLFFSGAAGLLWHFRGRIFNSVSAIVISVPVALMQPFLQRVPFQYAAQEANIPSLGLFFLKIGSILYGSGYVLIAFLQSGLVDARHWITQPQLLDAIAVGQFTPGPVLSTATFIGYLVLGLPGAAVSTVGIFLPSFVFVFILSPVLVKVRSSPTLRGFLNGVNAASLGLLAAITIKLALTALIGFSSWCILLVAALILLVWNINSVWIIVGSGIVGWLFTLTHI